MTSLIRIEKVNKDSNAEKSGLLVNDFILQVNKVEIKNIEHFKEVWRNCDTKNVNVFLVRRKNDKIEIEIHMQASTVLGIATAVIEVNNNPKDKIKNITKTKTKEIILEEAIELINKNESELNEEIINQIRLSQSGSENIIELHSGNSKLEDLLIGENICIVNGNLTVNNLIEDCDEVDSSLLIVLGNVKCKNLITLSSMFITGDLIVDNVILGDSLCDYTLNVGGNIKTETILDYGHSIVSLKKITAKNILLFNNIEDQNGEVEETMTFEDLIGNIIETDGDKPDLPNTIDFIKNGGTKFHK